MASKMNPGFMAMMKKKAPAKKMALGGAAMGAVKKAIAPMKMQNAARSAASQATFKPTGGAPAPKQFMSNALRKVGKAGAGAAGKMFNKGGLAAGHKAADGIASKGKTKAKMVTMGGSTGMKRGGKVC
jgi:hypothetical protein